MGSEFWNARELQIVLEYQSWDKFKRVIAKAISACETSGASVDDHFSQVGNMVEIGSGATREVEEIQLSRYAGFMKCEKCCSKSNSS